jgi:gentisate 1,2-dioxygenase
MELEDFNRWLAERNMGGMWNMNRGSAEEVKPCLWKWDDIHTALTTAAELVPIDQVAMRTVQLKNPGLTGRMSNTLHFSVQCLMPGERTKAHRNLVSETRFVIQAPKGAEFIVDGESFPMESGDVVTTPNWSWHDHHNGGDAPAIWLDGMDTRLVGIGKGMNERFPGGDQQPIERQSGYFNGLASHAKPSWMDWDRPTPPPHRYMWGETSSALMALREQELEGDPCDGLQLTYTNPLTGGPTLPTYACEIALLNPRQKLAEHRHNSTTVYAVYRGQGATTIEGERFEWSQGDILIVPPWAWHFHENGSDQDALLYSIGDWPAMQALALYREERRG